MIKILILRTGFVYVSLDPSSKVFAELVHQWLIFLSLSYFKISYFGKLYNNYDA